MCLLGVATLLAIAFTWPLAARLGSAGRLDSSDGRFSIWNVAWVAHALTSEPSQLWNANIFYPHTGTLAYSESNLVAGIIATPVWAATHNPLAATNFVIVCSFVLAAVCMFALARHLTESRPAAALAATLFAFNSYVFSHLTHIQLLMTFGLPLAMLCMHRFVEQPSTKGAVRVGLAVGLQAIACGYYGVFGGLAVAVGIAWFGIVNGHWRSTRFWLLAIGAGMVALLVVAPLLPNYLASRAAGLDRTLAEARLFSVRWRSYLASGLLAYRWMLPIIGRWREVLFPGVLALAFSGIAVALNLARRHEPGTTGRYTQIWFYVVLATLAAWASFGPDAGLYRWMYDALPVMSFLRAPSRFGIVVIFGLAVLAAYGLALLDAGWSPRRRRVYLALLAIVALARSTVGPLELRDAPAASNVYRQLSQMPRGPVAEFPFFIGPRLPRQTEYMLTSTLHWQPLINGFSDYVPSDVEQDLPLLDRFPQAEAMYALSRRGVRYVVVHWDKYGSGSGDVRAKVEAMSPVLRKVLEDPSATLFELTALNASSR